MNKVNLLKLARFLVNNAETIQFDMCSFREVYECKTVCCAIGWGLMAGVEDTKHDLGLYYQGVRRCLDTQVTKEHLISPYYSISGWTAYSSSQFVHGGDVRWDWMFSNLWSEIDNTAIGAAKRIFWLLKNGDAPAGFNAYDLENGTEETDYYLELYKNLDITEFMQEDFDKVLALLPNYKN